MAEDLDTGSLGSVGLSCNAILNSWLTDPGLFVTKAFPKSSVVILFLNCLWAHWTSAQSRLANKKDTEYNF